MGTKHDQEQQSRYIDEIINWGRAIAKNLAYKTEQNVAAMVTSRRRALTHDKKN